MTGEPPFSANNRELLYRKILNSQPEYDTDNFDNDCIDLIKKMLDKDYKNRINIESVKKHKFFKDINFNEVEQMKFKCPIMTYLKKKFDINKIHD